MKVIDSIKLYKLPPILIYSRKMIEISQTSDKVKGLCAKLIMNSNNNMPVEILGLIYVNMASISPQDSIKIAKTIFAAKDMAHAEYGKDIDVKSIQYTELLSVLPHPKVEDNDNIKPLYIVAYKKTA